MTEFDRDYDNMSERNLLGRLLILFKKVSRKSTIDWAESERILSAEESAIRGKFNCSRTPAFKYIYSTCDNWYIHVVGMMKSSQIGASELENNIIGRNQDINPCHTVVFFPGNALLEEYSKKRFQPFFNSCKVLKDKLNIGIPKPSHKYFTFPGGSVGLKTLGSIQSVLSSPIPFIVLEEFAQVKSDVAKQGDPLGLVIGRQKSFAIGRKKVLGFSTPTFKDSCNMEKLYNKGTKFIFKAKCHCCNNLLEVSGFTMEQMIQYDEYQDRVIHPEYGKYNPDTATFVCTICKATWDFSDKTSNIIEGLNYGMIDDCGDFTYGWHSEGLSAVYHIDDYKKLEPSIDKLGLKRELKLQKKSLTYTFQHPEILACFEATSDARVLATKKILAEVALDRNDETLKKDWCNNSLGLPYASGITAIEADEMKTFRKNYIEHVVPMEGLVLTLGIDVQDNRFAIILRAWGRNNNSWLVTWKEIFGDVKVQNIDETSGVSRFTGVWGELSDYVMSDIPHASGKKLKIAAISIDAGDNTELVYKWVLAMQELNPQVFATKGTRDLRFSTDGIYQEPIILEVERDRQYRKSLSESMGVTLFKLGAHVAHEEILRRISLNSNKDAYSNVYYFNEQSYGGYEEQMCSCRKITDSGSNNSFSKAVFKLIAGKRKEAMDAEKNALHAAYAVGIRNYTNDHWRAIEQYLYN